jgi:hypothetical protein
VRGSLARGALSHQVKAQLVLRTLVWVQARSYTEEGRTCSLLVRIVAADDSSAATVGREARVRSK